MLWHQMAEVGAAAVSVVQVEFVAVSVEVVQPEIVEVQVALVLVETAEEVCPVDHDGVGVEDEAMVGSTGDAAQGVICFEMGVPAEAGVAGPHETILTVHGAGEGVLETYSFEIRQSFEEDWLAVFLRVHPHEAVMVQVEVVAAAAVLNPVAAYLSLLFWLSMLPNYLGPCLLLPFHQFHISPSSYLQGLRDWQRSLSCFSVPFGFVISTALENPLDWNLRFRPSLE